jgi:hypothetical protein
LTTVTSRTAAPGPASRARLGVVTNDGCVSGSCPEGPACDAGSA